MKILKSISVLVVFGILVFSSCKNDLKLNAPYKEIPSIYAVLNPQEKLQMIRINKVFLGEGDANQMAQVADSINYPQGELSVTLTHSSGTVTVFRDSVIQTASGAFNRTQRVYLSTEPLKKTGSYTLTVKNNKTGNVFTSHSDVLDSLVAGYAPFSPPYYPEVIAHPELYDANNPVNYINYGPVNNVDIKYSTRYNINSTAKVYQFSIRMHYYDSLISGNNQLGYIDYNFNNQYASDANPFGSTGVLTLPVTFTSSDFFSAMGIALKNKYPTKNDYDYFNFYGRKIYKAQFFIYSSTQDYLDYLQYVQPSLSISQNKSLYSNFDNRAALGIFTFRSRSSVQKAVHTFFMNEFATNANTKLYKFLKSTGKLP